jgi:glycerol-3-phosphate acyltransferase PlsX
MLRSKPQSAFSELCGTRHETVFREIKKDMSPEDYGGAPLIGVDGISIICHGNSTPVAITNAIRVARQLVLEKVNDQIKIELARKNAVTE